MISLTVTGHAEPEQDRAEIARLLKEYGVGAVCLLRDGTIASVNSQDECDGYWSLDMFEIGDQGDHLPNGLFEDPLEGAFPDHPFDIIRVWPKGERLRLTVEVLVV